MVHRFLIAIFVCFVATSAMAENATLSGMCIGPAGNRLAGVKIVVKKPCRCDSCPGCKCCPNAASVVTNSQGIYQASVPGDFYEVTASLPGFVTARVTMKLASGKNVKKDFRLKRAGT